MTPEQLLKYKKLSHFDKWFVEQIQVIIDAEEEIKKLRVS